MKLRPMTWGRWAELIFGALFPTVVLGPTAALGMLFLISTLYTVAMSILLSHQALQALTWGRGAFGLVWVSLPGAGGIASLWLLILFGPKQIKEHPWLLWFVVLAILSAEIVALLLLWGKVTYIHPSGLSLTALLIAMAEGFWYLSQLFRRTNAKIRGVA